MSIRSAYMLICDTCARAARYYDGGMMISDALADAERAGWRIYRVVSTCQDCPPLCRECLGDLKSEQKCPRCDGQG